MALTPFGIPRRSDPTRPVAGPGDLPTAAQHAGYADDGRDALDEALRATRLADAFKGGRLSDAQARRVLERIVAVGRADVGDIARRLVDGLASGIASLGGWFRGMLKAIIPNHYATSFALLRSKTPAPADMTAIQTASDAQVGFLARFRRNLATGLQRLDKTVVPRAEMYADAAWGVAYNVMLERATRDGYREGRRRLHGEAHCPDCPRLAALGWVPIDQVVKIGDSVCLTRCRCELTFR